MVDATKQPLIILGTTSATAAVKLIMTSLNLSEAVSVYVLNDLLERGVVRSRGKRITKLLPKDNEPT